MKPTTHKQNHIYNITVISVCTAIVIASAYLTIPFFIGITLQTLAIMLICMLFDLKISFSTVLIYILIGAIGLPVFSGFGGGLSFLVGPTGGFILSFLLFPIIFKLLGNRFRQSHVLRIISMCICIVVCYACGTAWYCFVYLSGNVNNLAGALSICVFPFIIPDIIKIFIADILYSRLSKIDFNRQWRLYGK